MSKKAGADNDDDAKRRRKRNKKPKDMPRRPLSAYNLFFAEERERILSAQRQGIDQPDFVLPDETQIEQQGQKDGKKKAPVLFQALAKCVGRRWGALSAADKEKYTAQAEEEMKRYREKMDEYQQTIVMQSMANSVEKRKHEPEESQDGPDPAAKKQAIGKTESDSASKPMPTSALAAPVGTAGMQLGGAGAASAGLLNFPQGLPPNLNPMQVLQQPFNPSSFLQQPMGMGGAGAMIDPSTGLRSSQQLYSGFGGALNTAQIPLFMNQQQLSAAAPSVLGFAQQDQAAGAAQSDHAQLQQQQQQAFGMLGSGFMGGQPSDLFALQIPQQQQVAPQLLGGFENQAATNQGLPALYPAAQQAQTAFAAPGGGLSSFAADRAGTTLPAAQALWDPSVASSMTAGAEAAGSGKQANQHGGINVANVQHLDHAAVEEPEQPTGESEQEDQVQL